MSGYQADALKEAHAMFRYWLGEQQAPHWKEFKEKWGQVKKLT